MGASAAATAITYNTATTYSGFLADGTQQSLSLTANIPAANKGGKLVQSYSDTLTITTSFGVQ
jgi:hypothetical protein